MRKKSRLFALAEVLRARRTGITAAELADRFGVTLRTIYRDIEALQDAGMPIRADRGRGGGYALDKSYQLPPINLTAREAALVCALGRMAREQRLLPDHPQAAHFPHLLIVIGDDPVPADDLYRMLARIGDAHRIGEQV